MAKANTPRRRRRWLLVIGGVLVVLGLSAAIAWWRLRVPRCEVEPLEQLGLDLADDDPVERLDRVHEVVDTLRRSCEVVSLETEVAIQVATRRQPPRSSWRIAGSRRYGCPNGVPSTEEQRRCLELGGFPQQLAEREEFVPRGLWTELMLEDLGVSRRAAQQLAWLLKMGVEFPLADTKRQQVHSPAIELWPTQMPRGEPGVIGVQGSQYTATRLSDWFIVDREVTVSRLHEAEIRGPALFHVYSVALGDAFPTDAWIPLRVNWTYLDCDEALACELPFGEDEQTEIAILNRGVITHRGAERSANPTAGAHLFVPDREATWDEIASAAVALAPADCFTDEPSSACAEPWVSLWLSPP